MTGEHAHEDPREATKAAPQLEPATLERLRRGLPLHMDRQGNFSFEGDPITHPGVIALFRRGLDGTESGEVKIQVGQQWVYLKLDDLPLRAHRIDRPRAGEAMPHLILDDGRRLALDPTTLWEEPDAGLRCTVPSQCSGRPLSVRLSNTAAIDLSRWFVWTDEDARPVLQVGGHRWAIPDRPPE